MERYLGTVSRGIRTPIIQKGDNIVEMTVDSIMKAAEHSDFELHDKDVIAITESVVARAQGNYASIDDIATDVRDKFREDTIGVIFPITSRNRFSICLSGIARAVKKIYLMLSYPADEMGNHLISLDQLDEHNVNPWSDVLTEERYRELFGYPKHEYTGMDYVEYYRDLVEAENCELEIIFANDCRKILEYTDNVLYCDIHTRHRTKRLLEESGVNKILGLEDILNTPINGSGYNEDYGLLGCNKATDETIKLFPRNCQPIVDDIQKLMYEKTGLHIEAMVYGDGAFKDPNGKIWELADPVVSPAYTSGLEGRPSEIKLKYLADNDFSDLEGKGLEKAIANYIAQNETTSKDSKSSQGTTPRCIPDLLGSLADLTSGSGDKGTPVILIQGYFDSFAV